MGGSEARLHAELPVDVLQVVANSVLADAQGMGDVGVGASLPEKIQHLRLAAGEPKRAQGLCLRGAREAHRDGVGIPWRAAYVACQQLAPGNGQGQWFGVGE